MSDIETGGPAFPEKRRVYMAGYPTDDFEPRSGMTMRQYAAIKLRVPNSGDEWLDKMIVDALLNDFAAKAMLAMASSSNSNPNTILPVCENAYRWADAMLKARKP